jgi:hypothetical protein
MIRSIRRAAFKILFSISKYPQIEDDFYTKEMMLLGGSTELKSQGGYSVGDMSGINVGKTPFWLRRSSRPGKKITKIPDWNKRISEIADNAPNWDIGSLSGIPSWMQLMIEKVVEKNGVGSIHDLWPNLQLFIHGGISFEPHRKSFEALMTKPMIYIDTYLTSEGFIAFQKRQETRAMALILNNGIFHEFIPFNDQNFDSEGAIIGKPRAYTVEDIEEGIDYALVISTNAGAWRYLIGDTVRFTDKKRCELIITGRTKHFLSVCGEHLSVDNMNQGIVHLQNKFQTIVRDFTVSAVLVEGKYTHRWYIGCDDAIELAAAQEILDNHLKEINDDYATERGSVLRAPELVFINPDYFYRFMESKGKIGGQSKFPRVMKNKEFQDWESFIAVSC